MQKSFTFKKIIPSILIVAILATGIFSAFGVEAVNAAQLRTPEKNIEMIKKGNELLKKGIGKIPVIGEVRSVFKTMQCFTGDGFRGCVAFLAQISMEVFAWILGLTGIALNQAVNITVLSMGANLENFKVIEEGWTIFRDLANIIIIFALLFIGITTILRLEKYNTKKLLSTLIIAALLINFSLFFAKVIIDTSNLLAANFYKKIENVSIEGFSEANIGAKTSWSGISDSYMQALTLTTLYDVNQETGTIINNPTENLGSKRLKKNKDGSIKYSEGKAVIEDDPDSQVTVKKRNGKEVQLNWRSMMLIGILGSILFLITAFSFLAVTVLLVIRYVVLLFLMMLSPIALAGMILPAMQKYSKMWWDNLFSYAFFAPAYLLITWIVVMLINSEGFRTSIGFPVDKNTIIVGNVGLSQIIINFIIIIALVIFSILLSKYMGIAGSTTVISWGQSARKWGQGVVGRNTVGYAGQWARRGIEKGQKALERTEPTGRVGGTFKKIGLATTRGAKKGAYGVEGFKFQSAQSKRGAVEARDKDIERDIKERAGDPKQLAGYFASLNKRQQQEAYRNMSDRDQAALDEQLDNKHFGGPLPLGAPPRRVLNPTSDRLRKNLSTDKREKVEKAAKDAREKWENTEVRKNIDNIAAGRVNPVTKAPYTTPEIDDMVNRLKPNEARKLSDSARKNPEIIHRLKPRHLADLQREGNLTPSQVRAILIEIHHPTAYANQAAQFAFVDDPVNSTYWT